MVPKVANTKALNQRNMRRPSWEVVGNLIAGYKDALRQSNADRSALLCRNREQIDCYSTKTLVMFQQRIVGTAHSSYLGYSLAAQRAT